VGLRVARRRHQRNEREQRHDRHVLEQEDRKRALAVVLLQVAAVFQDAQRDRGGRKCERKACDQRGAPVEHASEQGEAGERRGGEHQLRDAEAEDVAPHREQAAELELEPDQEQQHHDAELGDGEDGFGPAENAEPVRADHHARNQIRDDRRELCEPRDRYADHGGGKQHQGEGEQTDFGRVRIHGFDTSSHCLHYTKRPSATSGRELACNLHVCKIVMTGVMREGAVWSMPAGAAVFAGVAIAAGPAAATDEFSTGNWSGRSHVKNGTFSHCVVWAPFINRWDLFFSIRDDGYFSMTLRNPDLDLRGDLLFGASTGIRLQIDDTPLIIRPFTPVAQTMTSTTFATDLDWVQRLSTGKVLRINNGRTYRFPLDGLKEALVRLRACAAKYRSS
jgi:hypothetical protein